MSISFTCECGKSFTVADEFAGKRTKCPVCRALIVVPVVEAESYAFQDSADEPSADPRRSISWYATEDQSCSSEPTTSASTGNSLATDAARFAMSAGERKDADEKAARDRPRDGAGVLDKDTVQDVAIDVLIKIITS